MRALIRKSLRVALPLACFLVPGTVCGQDVAIGVLEGLIKGVDNVNISGSAFGRFTKKASGSSSRRRYGEYGLEITYDLGEFQIWIEHYCHTLKDSATAEAKLVEARYKADSAQFGKATADANRAKAAVPSTTKYKRECPQVSVDSTLTQVVTKSGAGQTIVEDTYAVKKSKSVGTRHRVNLELGFSYDQIEGVSMSQPEIKASMRDFPAVSMYLTGEPADPDSSSKARSFPVPFLYAGVRTGLLKLASGRGYIGDTVYTLNGQTFTLGGVLGVEEQILKSCGVFLELAYTRRRFGSVEWGLPPDSISVPAVFPRKLDFSGYDVSLGVSFQLPKK